jgi:hypothetical protein
VFNTSENELRLAVHEAGHAVFADFCRIGIKEVWINSSVILVVEMDYKV